MVHFFLLLLLKEEVSASGHFQGRVFCSSSSSSSTRKRKYRNEQLHLSLNVLSVLQIGSPIMSCCLSY